VLLGAADDQLERSRRTREVEEVQVRLQLLHAASRLQNDAAVKGDQDSNGEPTGSSASPGRRRGRVRGSTTRPARRNREGRRRQRARDDILHRAPRTLGLSSSCRERLSSFQLGREWSGGVRVWWRNEEGSEGSAGFKTGGRRPWCTGCTRREKRARRPTIGHGRRWSGASSVRAEFLE
jgi:hypothetical protein